MKYIFLTSLQELETDRVYNKGKLLFEGMRLSNSKGKLESLVGEENFKKYVGQLEYDQLLDSNFLYKEGKLPENLNVNNRNERLEFLDELLKTAQAFCSYLWFEKDSSVSMDTGFLYIKDEKSNSFGIASNVRTIQFLNSECKRRSTLFTDKEISNVLEFVRNRFDLEYLDKNTEETIQILNDKKQTNRIMRFTYMLQACRSQPDFPSRIGLYCTLLETLLSTSNTELTHKLSERTAKLLGGDIEERLEIYNAIIDAYSIRSSFVHGDIIEKRKLKDIGVQRNISKTLDDYLRKIIIKIFSDAELEKIYVKDNKKDLEQWFRKLVLS